jgi:hypothetical protein
MTWRDWEELLDNEDEAARNTYIAEEQPTSVVISPQGDSDCYMGAGAYPYGDPSTWPRKENHRNVMYTEKQELGLQGEHVRVERAEGVRLDDVLDELCGVMDFSCDCDDCCEYEWPDLYSDSVDCPDRVKLDVKMCWDRKV